MKIVKVGKGIQQYTKRCPFCKSVLCYTDYDLERNYWLGSTEFVLCPVCHRNFEHKIKPSEEKKDD